ncbi:hypothetical protein CK203_021365 [Vitis vinifera]|uniref:PGG domain-containing protein n=1 Tax=Vitis vinifera TaxID=29760 RepID=A0A438IS88_VITVI|nr:hypothetical protein CK203_021365 [Vitis vinifera]
MAGALILMATLIATVTFAAAFTIPGGFQAEDPHKGMVVLGRNMAFRTFIITDTIAMTSSMMAALILIIMPFQTDEEIIKSFLGYSLLLLWLALMAKGIAFVTGVCCFVRAVASCYRAGHDATPWAYVMLGLVALGILLGWAGLARPSP